jgi:hypothetical protein
MTYGNTIQADKAAERVHTSAARFPPKPYTGRPMHELFEDLRFCKAARLWVEEKGFLDTPQGWYQAWRQCPRGPWVLWLLFQYEVYGREDMTAPRHDRLEGRYLRGPGTATHARKLLPWKTYRRTLEKYRKLRFV